MKEKLQELEKKITTRFAGRKIYYYPSLPSTMDTAREKALKKEIEGAVVAAGCQTGGRGRKSRPWCSPEGNLFVSIICYPDEAWVAELVMCGALAVLETIKTLGVKNTGIKWPNDVLIGGKKVSGILVESRIMAGAINYGIVGIGINVNAEVDNLEKMVIPPTSLAAEIGEPVNLAELFECLISNFDLFYSQLKDGRSLLEQWKNELVTLGQKVTVEKDSSFKGVACGVNASGNLILRLESGEEIVVTAGDVRHSE
jgi:BirA family biotin operon repressor/biotin-[acetyl-CoA-carboxylase] ligase